MEKQTGKWKLRWNSHSGDIGHVHNNEQDEIIYKLLNILNQQLEVWQKVKELSNDSAVLDEAWDQILSLQKQLKTYTNEDTTGK